MKPTGAKKKRDKTKVKRREKGSEIKSQTEKRGEGNKKTETHKKANKKKEKLTQKGIECNEEKVRASIIM
jgi:hypothetical protein